MVDTFTTNFAYVKADPASLAEIWTYHNDNMDSIDDDIKTQSEAYPGLRYIQRSADFSNLGVNGVARSVSWERTEELDSTGCFTSDSVNTYVQQAGVYLINASCQWEGNPGGYRRLTLNLGGVDLISTFKWPSNNAKVGQSLTWLGFLSPVAAIQVMGFQNSGNDLYMDFGNVMNPNAPLAINVGYAKLAITRLY